MHRAKLLFVVLAFAALALWPLFAGRFGIDLVTKIMIFAVFALSLELLVGQTGLQITVCHFPPGTQCRCLTF